MKRSRNIHGGIFARWPFWAATIAVLLAVGVSTAGLKSWFNSKSSSLNDPTAPVRQGPLTISVTETGSIKASEVEIIKSEVEGQAAILYLIPEGTVVEEGDLLVELDSSELQDQLVDQEIRVKNADADLISAEENLAVVKSQSESDIASAQLDYDFAVQDLKKYNEGEYPKQVKELETKITLAKEELDRAREDAEWSKVLYDEKYLSESEYKSDQLAAQRRELELELAEADLSLLRTFTYERQIRQLESDVEQTEMALERVKRKARANTTDAEARLEARKLEAERQRERYDKIEEQIAKATIVAPAAGLVVYATSAEADWRGNDEPLDEGQTVRERQELIHLPRTSTFIVETSVHESSLEKIRLGLPVRIKVDTSEKTYTGRVSKIAPLPDATSMFMNPDLKVYPTEIAIDGESDELRTGMSCTAEIIVSQFPDAMYIPVQAVTRIAGDPVVYVAQNNQWVPRKVQIGLDNNRMIHIIDGLAPDENVLLTPPLKSDGNEQMDETEIAENEMLLARAEQEPLPQRRSMAGMDGATTGTMGRPDMGATGMPENMSPEDMAAMRGQAMERMRSMGIPMDDNGMPDFSSMSDEQRQQLMQMGGGRGGRGSTGGRRGGGAAPGAEGGGAGFGMGR